MVYPEPSWLFPVVAAVQVFGLICAWLARASQKSPRHHAACQAIFLLALALVAGTAIAATQFPSAVWLLCGITLPIMIVGATCDFHQTRYAQHTN